MRKTVLVFACVMLVAGVVGAQGNGQWCPEGTEPCVRILDPVDGEVQPDTAFLAEYILTPDFYSIYHWCEVRFRVSQGQTPDSSFFLDLRQHQRPRGDSPAFYKVDSMHLSGTVITVARPSVDEGDYLPHRFRILGELNGLVPGDSLVVHAEAVGNGCGSGYSSHDSANITVISD